MWPFAFEGRELSPANDKLATKCRNGCGHLLAIGRIHCFVLRGFGSNDICLHAKSLALKSPTGGLCELPLVQIGWPQYSLPKFSSFQLPFNSYADSRIARVMSALGRKCLRQNYTESEAAKLNEHYRPVAAMTASLIFAMA